MYLRTTLSLQPHAAARSRLVMLFTFMRFLTSPIHSGVTVVRFIPSPRLRTIVCVQLFMFFPPHKKTLPSHTRWCKMILWVCFTLGNIFGFRAESRSEGARDPLLFSPGAHALTPDQQDGVWGGDCCCCRRTCFFKLYADKLEKRRFTQNVQPKKKLRTTLALPLKSLWAQKRARRDGRARQTDAGNCGVA